MAIDVVINSKGLFKKDIQVDDVIFEGMCYGVMDEAYRLEEGIIGDLMVVFNNNCIGRGYELSFSKGKIGLIMPLPTSEDDINFFYEYIRKICMKMKTDKFIRNQEEVKFEQIDTCIENDIVASKEALKQIGNDIDNGKYENMYLFGAINPIAIGKDELIEIAGSPKNLGILMNRLQQMDIYYAKAKVYKRKNNTYFGVYILTENVPTVLPYEPKILMMDNNIEINDWNISFIINNDLEGSVLYSDFINFIKGYEKYDSEHFIITLDSMVIKKLLDKHRIEL